MKIRNLRRTTSQKDGSCSHSALIIAILFLLLAFPSMPTEGGTLSFNPGPYTLDMHFDELPKPWWKDTWWDTNWTFRKKLTFDNQMQTETFDSMTVLVLLNNTRIDYSKTQNSGEDIRFVDSNGTAFLDYEIEEWNESGTSAIWVKVPVIDGGSMTDHIWMYYGNPAAVDRQKSSRAWVPTYEMVHHLNQTSRTAGAYNDTMDSTINGHNMEANMEDSHLDVTGKVGSGIQFDGINDYVESNGNEMNITHMAGTVELWVQSNNASATMSILDTWENWNRIIWTEGGQFHASIADSFLSTRQLQGGVVDTNWHYISFAWDITAGELYLYVDGVLVDSNIGPGWAPTFRFSPTRYGDFELFLLDWPTRNHFDGTMDEIRVSNVVRSADWTAAQYKSMTDTFITYGPEETRSQYRQKITVTATSSGFPAGYAIPITFDHASLVGAGKSLANGDDVRIVYWDSTNWTEVNRVLDESSSWDNASTKIWIPLQRDIAATSYDEGYYLYYGSADASKPPTNAYMGAEIKLVQSGSAINAVNGTVTVNILPVNMSRAFLMFTSRHNSSRPVGSEVRGRIAAPSQLEFIRSTDEVVPFPITIEWYVVEFKSGVKVQRGEVAQTSTNLNIPINPVATTNQAFVTWSKSPGYADQNWNYDDPFVMELTNTSNLQLRVDTASGTHTISWQVIEFTSPMDADVQTGSTNGMNGTSTSLNLTLQSPVNLNDSFALVGYRTPAGGADVGSRILRAQLTDSSTLMVDRGLSGSPDNMTEIFWQIVNLDRIGEVMSGSEGFGIGENQKTVTLARSINVSRSVAFASVQAVAGQNMGRSTYAGDDVPGVGSVSMNLSANQIIMERANSSGDADIGWHVVEFNREMPTITLGAEETVGNIQIEVSVYHTRFDGSDAQEIVTSPVLTIDATTPNPCNFTLGVGSQYDFNDTDPRLLRFGITVVAVNGGERMSLAYDSMAQPSSLGVPSNGSNEYYLRDINTSGVVPPGRIMDPAMGNTGANMIFDTVGQIAYWYSELWQQLIVAILDPVQDQHITGAYPVTYSIGPNVVNITFEYLNGMLWVPLGPDPDLDGSFQWDTCIAGDRNTTLKAVARDNFNNINETSVTGIEIDCTPPSIQITQPVRDSIIHHNVTMNYSADLDAVSVELLYNDGVNNTITIETPPDGTAVWDVSALTLTGVSLYAVATDEVGLSSWTEVSNLSTPVPPAISITSPIDNDHVTGTFTIGYNASVEVASVEFQYWNSSSWASLGLDLDLDGSFPWNVCLAGDRVTDLKAIATNNFNDTVEDTVFNIEIDCTPPFILITQPLNDSIINNDVTISYATDVDAVSVELIYNDGANNTITIETPPDGTHIWNVTGLNLTGAALYAVATDEVGLKATAEVHNLSTPKPPWVLITSPIDDDHITGTYQIEYSISTNVTSLELQYWAVAGWNSIGFDLDLDGSMSWNVCSIGDMTTTLRAIAITAFSLSAEDSVTNIAIDCTPPAVQILQPIDDSVINGIITITYSVDADAVSVELIYNDGTNNSIVIEVPPDGTATWDVSGVNLSGATLYALATDEVGLTSVAMVVNLSTPVQPTVAILAPTDNEHITGNYAIDYTKSADAISLELQFWNVSGWESIGFDLDLDGSYTWNTCLAGDGVTTVRAIATNSFSLTAEDVATGVEIDCTPPAVQILQPTDFSIVQDNVTISYSVDPDAIRVELSYDDGLFHTFAIDSPPDSSAIWDITGLTLKGVVLRAIAFDEVGLSSEDIVVGLSTPEPPPPTNKPPDISGVPDMIVHYDHSYNFDLGPYIQDEDNTPDELSVNTSDRSHIWISPENNLGLVMNYPQSMFGQTVRVTIWVTDGIGSDYQVINVTVSDDYPPEKLRPLPDVLFNEDEIALNVFFTSLNYYFMDIDGDNLYYTSGNKSVSVRINPSHSVDMWADPDWFGFEIITIRATDPTGALVEDKITVVVNPVNDAPVIEEIPDIEVWVGDSKTVNLFDLISDIETPKTSLLMWVNDSNVEVDGFNITLRYDSDGGDTYITVYVSDGTDVSMRTVRVIVNSDDNVWLLILILILVSLFAIYMAWVYLTRRARIYGGYLLREDGSLIADISPEGSEIVPPGIIKEHAKAKGLKKTDTIEFEEHIINLAHGDRLHLAAVASRTLPKPMLKKLVQLVKGLEESEFGGLPTADEESAKSLKKFESDFKKMIV
jgi:hypothetical protein